MDRLPQTLLEDIISIVADDASTISRSARKKAVAPYAIVSFNFRRAVERITFGSLEINLSDVIKASIILNRHARWLYVKNIILNVLLPRYEGEPTIRLENPREMERNSNVFTQNILALFDLLSQWPGKDLSAPNRPALISLAVHVSSRTDTYLKAYGDILFHEERSATANDAQVWRYHRSVLQLDDSVTLPSLQHVPISKLTFPTISYRRQISAISLARITSVLNLNNVKFLSWQFGDVEKKDMDLRIARRQELANAIDALPKLEWFELNIEYYPPHNHDFDPPSLYETDPVSCALRRLGKRTKSLCIYGALASTELFWPIHGSNPTPEPDWGSLERLSLSFHPITPNGKWWFKNDEDSKIRDIELIVTSPEPDEIRAEEDDEWNLWRHAPIQRCMDEFYMAVGRAVAKMPKLVFMHLESAAHLIEPANRKFHIHHFVFDVWQNRRAIAFWYSMPGYEPSDAVMKVWERSAYERALELHILVKSEPVPDEEDDDETSEDGDTDGSDGSDDDGTGGSDDDGTGGSDDDGTVDV
ncbi:hypothetical protein F4781DRAFT_427581 [Annulohypoxylon bovei var. microspora]|nr:hypothetical protein F4781DRAFT_427581 [Annulohypoxylon bovei var. microspora]